MKDETLTDREKSAVLDDLKLETDTPGGTDILAELARSVASRKKDSVLTVRVNSQDLRAIKDRAKRLGVRYQTLISEVLHHIANSHHL